MAVTDESRRVLYKATTGQELAADADVRARLEDARRLWRRDSAPLDAGSTATVSMWICSDSDFYGTARMMIRASGLEGLKAYLCGVLRGRGGRRRTPAVIETSDDLSENDLRRVDWFSVAEDLIGD